MDNLAGQSIKGYELQELIGQGGFGAVYRATQAVVGREVAVKIILAHHANQPEFIRRFEAEAQIVARLEHLHIVPLYDYWRDPTGAYLIMRWLRGGTLRQVLEEGSGWSLREAARLLGQVASALGTAHQFGVVHRDVKPANILLDEKQNAYLSDFGIALNMSDAEGTLTNSMLTGSAGYISPEQVNMQPITHLADQYSLAVVMHEVLVGKHPFGEAQSTMALFIKHTSTPLPHLEDFPPSVNAVIQKASAKNPDDRYPDVISFAQAFKQAVYEAEAAGLILRAETGEYDFEEFEITAKLEQAAVQNPYKGLQAFQEGDADNFFGREILVEQLVHRLKDDHPMHRFLAVVGPSGSGKSSVVKAGLIPRLRQGALPQSDNWYILEMLPGTKPFEELETTLLRIATDLPDNLLAQLRTDPDGLKNAVKTILNDPEAELVLAIDQFEEIFTLLDDDGLRGLFLESLYRAVIDPDSQVRVLVTLRADFYDRPLMYPNISELMQQRTEVVIPLTPNELERTIVSPARRMRVGFEQGLASAIVSEVNEQPGVLPMLQYALTELFERRDNNHITYTAYRELGGVLGALARRADEIFSQFNTDEQEATRQLFLRLVTLGEGKEDTRRRALQSEILSAAAYPAIMQGIIDTFGKYRLLTFDRDPITRTPTVEVAHEALIREWKRLREWLDASREDVRLQRLLAFSAREWHEAKQDPSFLLRGGRLVQYEDWAGRTTVALTPDELNYLNVSITERNRLEAEEAQRQEKERLLEQRARQRLRFIIGIMFTAAIFGLMLSYAVFRQSQTAAEERDNARTQVALVATARDQAQSEADNAQTQVAIAATAQEDALSQANIAATSQSDAESQAAEAQRQANLAATSQSEAESQAAEAQRQANLAATSQVDAESQANIAATAQGEAQIRAVEAEDARVQAEAALQQANIAATAQSEAQSEAQRQADEAQRQADEAQRQANIAATAQADAQSQAAEARSLALAANAQQLLSNNAPLALALAVEANELVENPSTQTQRVLIAAVFSAPRTAYHEDNGGINQVLFTADGQFAVAANENGTISVWDVAAGTVTRHLEGHAGAVNSIRLSADGQTLISGGDDNTVIRWNFATGEVLQRFEGHERPITNVLFTPDETRILSASLDGAVIVWSIENGTPTQTLEALGSNPVNALAVNPNGVDIAVGTTDAIRIWNLNSNRFLELDKEPKQVQSLTFNTDGTLLASSGNIRTGTPQIWTISTRTAQNLPPQNGAVNSVAFSPDGTRLVAGASDFSVAITDLSTGALVRSLVAHTSPVRSAVFSPDGQYILSAASDGVMYLWDANPASQTSQYEGHVGGVEEVAFLPDNQTLLSVSNEGLIRTWAISGDLQTEIALPRPATQELIAQVSPVDTQLLAVGTTELQLVNLSSGETLLRMRDETPRAFIKSLAFSPDGTQVVWGGGYFYRDEFSDFTQAGLLTLWNAQTGELIRRFEGNVPDPIEGTNSAITSVAVSPDGQFIASGAEDGSLVLWNIATGERVQAFNGHSDVVTALDFSNDGQFLLSGGNDTILILWRVADGQILRRFTGHAGAVTSVAFSPDGKTAVSGGLDRQVILWDTGTAQLLRRYSGHEAAVFSVAFSLDGQFAASGSADGSLFLWQIDTPESLLAFARTDRYIPLLTCAEREQYGVELTEECLSELSAAPTPSVTP